MAMFQIENIEVGKIVPPPPVLLLPAELHRSAVHTIAAAVFRRCDGGEKGRGDAESALHIGGTY